MGYSVLSKDRMPRGRRPSGILSCEGRYIPWDTSSCSWCVNSHEPIHGNLELEAVIAAKDFLDLHW